MKVGDRVNWRGRPSHTGTVTEVNSNWYELLIKWDDGGSSWFSPGELEYLPEPWEKAAPPAAACRCPIKDLTSVGHTDPTCPERK